MYNFDASAIIYAWDNYPPSNPHFHSLWEWIGKEIQEKNFLISDVAYEEIKRKAPELEQFLKEKSIKIQPTTPEILNIAMNIKNLLGINEKYSQKGVNEPDLFIIANAKVNRNILVTEEARQLKLPKEKINYKIPAVCNLDEVKVDNINFVDLLKPND